MVENTIHVGYSMPTMRIFKQEKEQTPEVPKDDPIILNVTNLVLGINGEAQITITSSYSSTPSFKSSNEEVVKVDNTGKVTVVGPGSAVITVTVGSQTATCSVTVENKEITDYMYYGKISDVITSFQEITSVSGLTMVEAGVLDKTSIDLLEGEKVVVLIPEHTSYIATKDNGVGDKITFDDTYLGCNGELVTIDGTTYRCYGELAIITMEIFIYVD